jgi:SAM-dependent methyltransferase
VSEQDEIRATYERYAASGRARLWDRSNRGYARLSRERDGAVLALVRASLPVAGGRVLDVGCGDGSLAALAGDAGIAANWTGIDLLPERIDVARSRAPGARFVVGSADSMPFDDRSFDVAAALTLFSSLPSRELERAVAREIGRVVKPGGWLVWYDLRYGNPTNPAVHGLSAARLAELFAGWAIEVRTFSVAPPLARRLGPLTPIAYPILQAIPPLRSHLVGRLRCPT